MYHINMKMGFIHLPAASPTYIRIGSDCDCDCDCDCDRVVGVVEVDVEVVFFGRDKPHTEVNKSHMPVKRIKKKRMVG